MTATDMIGSYRPALDLKRGDHVQLSDGRWALLLEAPRADALWKDRVTASVCIEQRNTEGATWLAHDKAFSRSPEEQIRHVQTVFASMRPAAGGGGAS